MEQVIKEQVKKECNKICGCIYEETKGSIRVYPYTHIITSRFIVSVDMIKEEYVGMVDYYIGYDELKRELYISVGDSKMSTVNTPEDLQKIAVNLLVDLFKNDVCSTWDCSECPFQLEEPEEDPRVGTHNCGWILLRSATRKILRK